MALKELSVLDEPEVSAKEHEFAHRQHIVFVQNSVEGRVTTSCVRLLAIVLEDDFNAATDRHLRLEGFPGSTA